MFHVSGIVLLTLVVNGSLANIVVRYLHLNTLTDESKSILLNSIPKLSRQCELKLLQMKQHDNTNYTHADWSKVDAFLPDSILARNTQFKWMREDEDGSSLNSMVSNSETERRDDDVEMVEIPNNHINSINSDVASNDEMTSQMIRHILYTNIAEYERLYTEGYITVDSMQLLVSAAMSAQDTCDINMQWEFVCEKQKFPLWLLFASSFECVHPLIHNIIAHHLHQHIEQSLAFLQVLHISMQKVTDQLNMRQITDLVKSDLSNIIKRVDTWCTYLRYAFLDIYESVQTRNATLALLRFQRETSSSLLSTGTLQFGEYTLISTVIESEIVSLHHRQLSDDIVRTPLCIPYTGNFNAGLQTHVTRNFKHTLFNPGSQLETIGETTDGCYIVVRGLVVSKYEESRNERAENAVHAHNTYEEAYCDESVVGLHSALTGQTSLCSSTTLTVVEAYHVPVSSVHILMNEGNGSVEWLWRLIGDYLLKGQFTNELRLRGIRFENITSLVSRSVCRMAQRSDVCPSFRHNNTIILLMHGTIHFCKSSSTSSSSTSTSTPILDIHHSITAPALLQTSTTDDFYEQQIQFDVKSWWLEWASTELFSNSSIAPDMDPLQLYIRRKMPWMDSDPSNS